jgi:predicted dehydrogenase
MAPATAVDLRLGIEPRLPRRKDYRIGCVGAGFIMREVHLVAYQSAGFKPVAIASRTVAHAEAAARLRGVPRVHASWRDLVADSEVEILDIAFPPDQQLEVIRAAAGQQHIKGILAQKPLAMDYREARRAVEACREAGVKLAVNSNMRYDQSVRALKTVLDRGYLGEPVLATIDMRAVPNWQPFLAQYDRLCLLNMSIHHIDAFRYLFGDPERVIASVRTDPRAAFTHFDGIAMYVLEYASGLRAASLDDAWAWAGEGTEQDISIRWRVEGTDGMARGTIGWPFYPARTPSTIDFTTRRSPGRWFQPRWDSAWFPDAFVGTMAQLLCAVEDDARPEIDGEDNLKTMAAVDACYASAREGRAVALTEVMG